MTALLQSQDSARFDVLVSLQWQSGTLASDQLTPFQVAQSQIPLFCAQFEKVLSVARSCSKPSLTTSKS